MTDKGDKGFGSGSAEEITIFLSHQYTWFSHTQSWDCPGVLYSCTPLVNMALVKILDKVSISFQFWGSGCKYLHKDIVSRQLTSGF